MTLRRRHWPDCAVITTRTPVPESYCDCGAFGWYALHLLAMWIAKWKMRIKRCWRF